MPLLAYCIVLDDGGRNFPSEGILASKLQSISESGLIALCSELERNSISVGNFQQAALEFHHVIQAVFAETAIIPFRFPTWLMEEEIKSNLRQESARYKDFLRKHADHVQMEVRIQARAVTTTKPTSGTEHLRRRAAEIGRLNEQTSELKTLLGNTVIEWRNREVPDGVRLYALVSRKSVEDFREKLRLGGVRASGPWPATEFLEPTPQRTE